VKIFVFYIYFGVSALWSGLLGNPDLPSPHIVWMADGLLHIVLHPVSVSFIYCLKE